MQVKFILIAFCFSYVCGADRPLKENNKTYRYGMNTKLQIEANQDALDALADRVKMIINQKTNGSFTIEGVPTSIEQYLKNIPLNDRCVKSLACIVSTLALNGNIDQIKSIIETIKKYDENDACLYEVTGQVLVDLKREELLGQPFFLIDQFSPSTDSHKTAQFRLIRALLEQNFKYSQVSLKK